MKIPKQSSILSVAIWAEKNQLYVLYMKKTYYDINTEIDNYVWQIDRVANTQIR